MAINPAYGQFPRQRVPQYTAGQNSSNVFLKAMKERQDAEEAAKLAAKNAPVAPVVAPSTVVNIPAAGIAVSVPTPVVSQPVVNTPSPEAPPAK
ncbi:MAG: hypothetical protein V7K86_05635 [Nostoc sp.]|uniref:hypothetical protein n=1 Tax=Nostoc sp. TaxID=1180 RepID=UPI002FF9ECC5